IARDRFIGAGRVETVGTRKIEYRVAATIGDAQHAFLALDGDPGEVGDLLPASGEKVEKRGLAAIRVAEQGDAQGDGGSVHCRGASRATSTHSASKRRKAKVVPPMRTAIGSLPG